MDRGGDKEGGADACELARACGAGRAAGVAEERGDEVLMRLLEGAGRVAEEECARLRDNTDDTAQGRKQVFLEAVMREGKQTQ